MSTLFDFSSGNFIMNTSDDMGLSSDGHLMMRTGDSMTMDMTDGTLHLVSGMSSDDESKTGKKRHGWRWW